MSTLPKNLFQSFAQVCEKMMKVLMVGRFTLLHTLFHRMLKFPIWNFKGVKILSLEHLLRGGVLIESLTKTH